ncbi:putative ribosomal large subunit pseudouridine synthase B [Phaeobacter inhibens]|nr:putative ribosomal large subunit pseudouridine synthase B [Phaeobacter inhibens]
MIYGLSMSKTPSSPKGQRPGTAKPARNTRPVSAKAGKTSADTPATGDGPEGDRIAKVLSRAGVASRREAERMIAEGRVAVNGKVIDSPALNVVLGKDRIVVDGNPMQDPEPPRLWMYHKPSGLVTTTNDELDRQTIFDELPEDMPRVMTVGRLDLNSEGLLLLTNDGGIKRQLELPSTGWLRRYRVRINGRPKDTDFEPLRQGLVIEGERFQPMTVALDRQQGANAWLTIGLREGKNREIRRAIEDIGFTVNRLLRLSYGPFQLGNLKPGEVEELRPRVVRDQLGLAAPETEEDEKPKRPVRQRPGAGKPGPKPGAKPDFKSGGKPGGKPSGKPSGRSFGSADRSSEKPGDRSGARPAGKPGGKFAGKGKPSDRFAGKSEGKPTGRTADRTSDRPGGKPAGKFGSKPGGKPGSKFGGKPSGGGTGRDGGRDTGRGPTPRSGGKPPRR